MKHPYLYLSPDTTESTGATVGVQTAPESFSTSASEESELFGGELDNSVQEKSLGTTEKTTTQPQTQERVTSPTQQQQQKTAPTQQDTVAEQKPSMLKSLTERQKVSRDYSGFTDEEVRTLKSMSNEAFNHVAPILKQKKEFEASKDAMFFQHPDSYTLHPEYQRVKERASYAKSEANAWQDQLIKIREGDDWTPLLGVNKQTGEFVYGDPRPGTMQDEEMVRLAMSKCLQAEQEAQAAVQQIPQQFQSVVQQDLKNIQAERSRRFDWVADPKLLNHELEIEGVGKKSIQSIRNDFISLFPAYQQRTVGVDVAADLFVAMQIYASRLKMAEAGKQVAETLKQEATRVEPSNGTRPRRQANGRFGVTEFNLEGMPD